MEDTTQETSAETPKDTGPVEVTEEETQKETQTEDKVEAQETEGVEQKEDQPEGDPEQKKEESAEESLFKTLAEKKGLDPDDPTSREKIAKMAMDAEAGFTRKSQETSQMEKLIDSLLTEEGESKETQKSEETEETEDTGETQDVGSKYDTTIARLEAKDDMRTVADMYDDFYQYAEGMTNILSENPNSAQAFKGTKGVEMLYRMAKAEAMDDNVQKARQEGRKEASEKEVGKLKAQVASGTKAKTPTKKAFTREEIAEHSGDVEWMKKNLPEIERQAREGLIE